MEDWKINPEKYLTNSAGEYILNKDGTPRKKGGRPKNTELSEVKAALQAQKSLKSKNQKVKKLRRSLKKAETELGKKEKALTTNVLTESDTKELPDARTFRHYRF